MKIDQSFVRHLKEAANSRPMPGAAFLRWVAERVAAPLAEILTI